MAAPCPDNADIFPRKAELSTSNQYYIVNIARGTRIFKRSISDCERKRRSCEKSARKNSKGREAKTAALEQCDDEYSECVNKYLTKCTKKAIKTYCKECAICLEEYQSENLTAIKGQNCLEGHYFDYECLKEWGTSAASQVKRRCARLLLSFEGVQV